MMILVGEKINAATPRVRDAIQNRDRALISECARAQEEAGAHFLDVCVGGSAIGPGAKDAMAWTVEVVKDATGCGIVIDSSDSDIMKAGLEQCSERPRMINSATAERQRLQAVIGLSLEYDCPMVALAMADEGIPDSSEGRLSTCETIWKEVIGSNMSPENIYFDPLVLPIGTDFRQGLITLETLERIRGSFPGCGTILGLSNISYGLPAPRLMNRCFLVMAMALGLTAAILDITDHELMAVVLASEALVGNDAYCKEYLKAYRAGILTD